MASLEFYDDPATEIDGSDLTDTSQWDVAQLYERGDALPLTADGEPDVEFGRINALSFGLHHDIRGASETTRGQDAYLGRPTYPRRTFRAAFLCCLGVVRRLNFDAEIKERREPARLRGYSSLCGPR